jgi:hydroxyacylglutathione hydrolase
LLFIFLALQVKKFTFNPFQENTYVLFDETKECIIVDPGCYDNQEQTMLTQFITNNGLKVVKIVNTHAHIDHVLGNAFVSNTYNLPVYLHPIDVTTLKAVKTYAGSYGFHQYTEVENILTFTEKETLNFGNTSLEILFVPGHCPGHVAFYHANKKIIISGDVLFYQSIGRTDLPGGDFDTLIKSIHEKLFVLPDDVTVYCGHGPETSIGFEKINNPFCAVSL